MRHRGRRRRWEAGENEREVLIKEEGFVKEKLERKEKEKELTKKERHAKEQLEHISDKYLIIIVKLLLM